MPREVTMIVPPKYMAEMTGIWRIDIGARVIKAYGADGKVARRMTIKKENDAVRTMDFLNLIEQLNKHGN